MRLLACLAKAVVKNGLKLLVDGVPFAGALCEIARDTWESYRQPNATEAQTAAELEALAQAPAAQGRQQAEAAVLAAGADQSPQVRQALTAYLTQVPAMVRRSLRRPSDPTGTTVPPTLSLRKPEDLLPFLPARPPR